MRKGFLGVFGAFFVSTGLVLAQGKPAASDATLPSTSLCMEEKSCCQPCCCECPCGPPGRIWASADYLLWWTRGSNLPPLVTTSPIGTPRAAAGVLGLPGTTVLFGNGQADNNLRSGGRFTLGTWLDDNQTLGVEGNFFFLGQDATNFSTGSGGTPIVMRPFFNATTGAMDAQIVAFPGVLAGSVAVNTASDFWGGGIDLTKNLCCGCNYRVDLLGGYRFLKLDEDLTIRETLLTTAPSGAIPAGTQIGVLDNFNTNNQFHGGELGARAELRRNRLFMNVLGKVALGDTYSVADVNGFTQRTLPGGATALSPGGLLALPTNIGRYSQNTFAVVPEVGVNVGIQMTAGIRIYAGYSFLYWSSVARPGDQIDFTVNRTQLPPGPLVGAPRPAFSFQNTDFWAQGVNLGVEFRF